VASVEAINIYNAWCTDPVRLDGSDATHLPRAGQARAAASSLDCSWHERLAQVTHLSNNVMVGRQTHTATEVYMYRPCIHAISTVRPAGCIAFTLAFGSSSRYGRHMAHGLFDHQLSFFPRQAGLRERLAAFDIKSWAKFNGDGKAALDMSFPLASVSPESNQSKAASAFRA
jgi:hypothetical protein